MQCSKAITGQGNAKIVEVDYQSDPCNLKVTLQHESACAASDLDSNLFTGLIDDSNQAQAAYVFKMFISPLLFFGLVVKAVLHV